MTHSALIALLLALLLCALPVLGCAEGYPAKALVTDAQRASVDSLVRVNEQGTFYTLTYTANYKLDLLLASHVTDVEQLTKWVAQNLLASGAAARDASIGGGCSAFVMKDEQGALLYGRNYDYVQNAQNILVHCAPENGYQSVAMTACGWLWNNGEQLDDGKLDLSMLVAAPYLLMDGMNEKGLCVCTLTLDGAGTVQSAEGKNDVMTTVAMRLVLDRAASVVEAVALLKEYNMHAAMAIKNFHFMLADASGAYAVVEYAPDGMMRVGDETEIIGSLSTETDAHPNRLVTNFYLLFPGAAFGYDDGLHGLDRYVALTEALEKAQYQGSEEEAMRILGLAYQDYGATPTHETQWSLVYNPKALTAYICPRVDQTDKKDAFYQTKYFFDCKPVFESGEKLTFTVK